MTYDNTRIRKAPARPVSIWKCDRIRAVALSAAIGIILSCGLFFSCGKKANEEGTQEKPTSAKAVSPAEVRKSLEKLIGRWQRPDGGYVIDIRKVRADGELDAGYFNPRPINVSRAKAATEGGAITVFIELYDENYPGSTYDLIYDPRSDVLLGTYFQAAMRQSFEVVFVRMER